MEQFVVRLDYASSPGGIAFIGPEKADGFKAERLEHAVLFDDALEAERFADHFRRMWRGFYGFDPADVAVVRRAPECT